MRCNLKHFQIVLIILIILVIFICIPLPVITRRTFHNYNRTPLSYESPLSLHEKIQGKSFLSRTRDTVPSADFKRIFMRTLLQFDRVWRAKNGLQYMLSGGTLLGAYRHSAMIPYDNDMDVMIHIKHRKRLMRILKASSSLQGRVHRSFATIFLVDEKTTIQTKRGRWPYIDVLYFQNILHDKQLWKVTETKGRFHHHHLFPPIQLPFEGRMFPVPRCVRQVLMKAYGSDVTHRCCSHRFNHRKTTRRTVHCTPCRNMYGVLSFTRWRQINESHSQREVLGPSRSHNLAWQVRDPIVMPKCDWTCRFLSWLRRSEKNFLLSSG